MWRVAPTMFSESEQKKVLTADNDGFWSKVPTNAFQRGENISNKMRAAAMITPIPNLFRAGFIASAFGYGLTAFLISLRTLLIPDYASVTRNVNVLAACLYTGGFMAVISNIRYQLLQGIIEPYLIEKPLAKFPKLKGITLFFVRLANGLLGSILAIMGMRIIGLQKLK